MHKDEGNAVLTQWGRKGNRSVASRRRTANALISEVLFIIVASVAGFITAAFTDSRVWPLVVGAVAGSVGEWVYVTVGWKRGRRSRTG